MLSLPRLAVHRWLTIVSVLVLLTRLLSAAETTPELYPAIEPLKSGHLEVSPLHRIYWEVCGNEKGIPVIVLHGGPGGSAQPAMRRLCDPERFRIILFDQRGAGRSLPKAEWRENDTQHLIEDINRLRRHLGVGQRAILLGGSWGTTLAVAYAEAYPDLVRGLVLRGVFLGTKSEIDYFYHGGTATFFPKNFERLQAVVPRPERLDYPRQLFEMTRSDDPAVKRKAIDGWAHYEIRLALMDMTDEKCRQIVESYDMTAFSVLENWYMMNGCFFEEDELLRNAGRIEHIPTYIVHGRYDMICAPATARALADRLKQVELEFTRAGHSWTESANTAGILKGIEWVADPARSRTAAKATGKGKRLRVATAQIPVSNDIDANVAVICRAIDRAVAEGADILLTPEGSLSGYTPEFDREKVTQALAKVTEKARDRGLALALGTCFVEPEDGRCYNQLRFYDRKGKFLGYHAKILRCGTMSEPPKGEINDYAGSSLRTFELEGIRVGGLICNDMWGNPACTPMPETHLSQQLSRKGARIVFHAINGGRDGSEWSENVHWPFHESNMRLRARAGGLWVVSADNCAPETVPCSAPSGVLGPDGRWAARAPRRGEHVVVHTIELE